jgi:hypothetical protein
VLIEQCANWRIKVFETSKEVGNSFTWKLTSNSGYAIFGFMEDTAITERESEEIRRRLVVIRKYATGDSQAEFARLLGIAPNRWNNIERGYPLTLRISFMIMKQVKGISIGYILQGETERLPPPVKRQLAEVEEELFPAPRAGRSSNR